jgi:hypothetical protein
MVVSTNQWLTFRSSLADWRTDQQTERSGLVGLAAQEPGLSAHPLFFGREIFPIGLIMVGGEVSLLTEIQRTSDDLITDTLATEWLEPILTEDGVPLKIYDDL